MIQNKNKNDKKQKVISLLLAFSFILVAAQKDSDEEIRKIHEEIITIDTHCDTPHEAVAW